MPTKAKKRLMVRLALALTPTILLMACSAFLLSSVQSAKATLVDLGYPWAAAKIVPGGKYEWGYTTCPPNAPNCINKTRTVQGTVYGESDPYGYVFRNCTSFVAWKLVSLGVDPKYVKGLGNGGQWYDKASSDLIKGTVPKVGAAAVIPWDNPDLSPYGHVAYVDKVTYDANGSPISFEIQQSNWDYNGNQDQSTIIVKDSKFTKFVYFGEKMTNPPSNPTVTPTPTPTPSVPIAISRSPNTYDAFYITTNGDLMDLGWDSNPAIGHYPPYPVVTGNAAGRPAALARDRYNMMVAFRTKSGGISQASWNVNTGWGSPTPLVTGTDAAGTPTIVARDANHIAVIYRTIYGEIKMVDWEYGRQPSAWDLNPKKLVSADATGDPVAVSRDRNSADIFFIKNNGNLVNVSLTWNPALSTATRDWAAGAVKGSTPSAIVRTTADGIVHISVFLRRWDGWLVEFFWNWRDDWNSQAFAAQLISDPSAVVLSPGDVDIFYTETGGNIVCRYWSSANGWGSTNAIPAGATSGPGALTRNGELHAFHWQANQLKDGHWKFGSPWEVNLVWQP